MKMMNLEAFVNQIHLKITLRISWIIVQIAVKIIIWTIVAFNNTLFKVAKIKVDFLQLIVFYVIPQTRINSKWQQFFKRIIQTTTQGKMQLHLIIEL